MAFKLFVFASLLAAVSAGVLAPLNVHYQEAHPSPIVAVAKHVAYANPAVDAVASTHENVVRSYGGTVSTHSKAVETPYSKVVKADTRISNNVYTPLLKKTSITYAEPAPVIEKAAFAPTFTYAAPAAELRKTVSYAASPVSYTPVVQKSYTASPVYVKSPAYVAHQTPVVYASAPAPQIKVTSSYQHHDATPITEVKSTAAVIPTVANTIAYQAPSVTHYNHGNAATTYTHSAPGVSAYGTSQTVHYSPAEMVSHMSFDGFGTHWGY